MGQYLISERHRKMCVSSHLNYSNLLSRYDLGLTISVTISVYSSIWLYRSICTKCYTCFHFFIRCDISLSILIWSCLYFSKSSLISVQGIRGSFFSPNNSCLILLLPRPGLIDLSLYLGYVVVF